MVAATIFILAFASFFSVSDAFATQPLLPSSPSVYRRAQLLPLHQPPFTQQTVLHARGEGFDLDDKDDDRELVYVGRGSGRREREEGSYVDGQRASSSSSRRYNDNVEFFDLDDDDDFEDARGTGGADIYEESYNGIIPNPLLDAMDPDGVYERLGPELFKDWTFWRDMVLFVAFLALFTRDTHHYGIFDQTIEGLERLPGNFVP